ncbi:MAG: hypothetical protein DMD81_18810 [Candidatus Rokuibacteriota bacterium]|nr:MAG: hypothetical protein DMD81_18810 [Candidatus Rokubacteria bacterium]
MKSGRQRRAEIKLRRTARRAAVAARAQRAPAKPPERRVVVNPENLRPTNSYGSPRFVERGYYVDLPFTCKACGVPQVWTAAQQKWWYESAKADVWTTAARCRPCRIRERNRKAAAHKVHLDGLAKKAGQRSMRAKGEASRPETRR